MLPEALRLDGYHSMSAAANPLLPKITPAFAGVDVNQVSCAGTTEARIHHPFRPRPFAALVARAVDSFLTRMHFRSARLDCCTDHFNGAGNGYCSCWL